VGGVDAADGSDASPDGPIAEAGASLYALVGEEVVLDGGGSRGAVQYRWYFGDERGWEAPRDEAVARVVYDEPGRYRAVLTAVGADGTRRTDGVLVTVTHPAVHEPRHSSTVAWRDGPSPDRGHVAVVVEDADRVVVARRDGAAFEVERRLETCDRPRTVAWHGDWLVVPCQGADAVALLHAFEPDRRHIVELDHGARPFGALGGGRDPAGDDIWVTLQGPGEVAHIEFRPGGGPRLVETFRAIVDARGIAALPDGDIAVTRWRSRRDGGMVAVVRSPATPEDRAVEVLRVPIDPQNASDTEIGGLPSYFEMLAVSPTGLEYALPSLQANFLHGEAYNGEAFAHDTMLRAVVSFFRAEENAFRARRPGDLRRRTGRIFRVQFDSRGLASAAVYTSRGDYLFVAMRGTRVVERYDALGAAASGTIVDVGYAPQGLALSGDDRFLFVDASLSRELVVYDVREMRGILRPVARLRTVVDEPLSPTLLRGKQLFNDSRDPRLTREGYAACSHCHLDGESDRRIWDFTDRGEGLRNTISLLGRAGTGHGPLHWSANFDEIQDFEHDIREHFGGTGLLDDAAYRAQERDHPLGGAKAGVDEDLDALAAYVSSLTEFPDSPHRRADGSMGEAAKRGRAIFESDEAGCAGCHRGAALTDSAFGPDGAPIVHDVGTLDATSGSRLGGPLEGIDTPTLRGIWNTAPYLHHGKARTLRDVLVDHNPDDAHGRTSHLSDEQLDDLIAYLLAL
jgi:cytochrome c553